MDVKNNNIDTYEDFNRLIGNNYLFYSDGEFKWIQLDESCQMVSKKS